MPARKKARAGAPKASMPLQDGDSMAVDTPETGEPTKKPAQDPLNDPWTDEQETSLFKGIIRWKPAGWSFLELVVNSIGVLSLI
jgi:MRG-binding protein